MYIHKIKKEKFESMNYNYPLKQTKDRWGDYTIDYRGLTFQDEKKVFNYLEEQKQALKEHLKAYSDFDFSDEARVDLKQRRKEVFEKYFNTTGDFMLTITLK